MLARNSLFARFAAPASSAISLARCVAVASSALLVCSSCVRAATRSSKLVVGTLQFQIARFYLPQHVVEGADEAADFIVARRLDTQAVVLVARDDFAAVSASA